MNKKILIAIFAVFLVGGAVFTYALTQSEQDAKEEIEVFNEESTCSGDCDGNCNGNCGAVDCDCQEDKVESCGAGSCSQANQCAINPGSCGNSACGCGR